MLDRTTYIAGNKVIIFYFEELVFGFAAIIRFIFLRTSLLLLLVERNGY